MSRPLSEICARAGVLERRGPDPSLGGDPAISGLAYDSREVRPGYLFFALPGLHADGHRFVGAAIAAGAVAVVHSAGLPEYDGRVAYLKVADPRFAMSPIADDFHGRPSSSLGVVGVTGTEGKSTTVYLIYQLLRLSGRKAGFFSTVMSDTGSGEMPNPEHQTTPEATAVQRMLAAMRDSGCEYAVVESSSHGLSPRTNRLGDVAFDVGVFMNVTSEHLEFHGTWERYRDDKANLFRALDRQGHEKDVAAAAGPSRPSASPAPTTSPRPTSPPPRPSPRSFSARRAARSEARASAPSTSGATSEAPASSSSAGASAPRRGSSCPGPSTSTTHWPPSPRPPASLARIGRTSCPYSPRSSPCGAA